MAKAAAVVCTSSHAVDLDDGRSLEPGETVEGIDQNNPHNQRLLAVGLLTEVKSKVRSRHINGESEENN